MVFDPDKGCVRNRKPNEWYPDPCPICEGGDVHEVFCDYHTEIKTKEHKSKNEKLKYCAQCKLHFLFEEKSEYPNTCCPSCQTGKWLRTSHRHDK